MSFVQYHINTPPQIFGFRVLLTTKMSNPIKPRVFFVLGILEKRWLLEVRSTICWKLHPHDLWYQGAQSPSASPSIAKSTETLSHFFPY